MQAYSRPEALAIKGRAPCLLLAIASWKTPLRRRPFFSWISSHRRLAKWKHGPAHNLTHVGLCLVWCLVDGMRLMSDLAAHLCRHIIECKIDKFQRTLWTRSRNYISKVEAYCGTCSPRDGEDGAFLTEKLTTRTSGYADSPISLINRYLSAVHPRPFLHIHIRQYQSSTVNHNDCTTISCF